MQHAISAGVAVDLKRPNLWCKGHGPYDFFASVAGLARRVLTDSCRGIALSGSNTTLPSIIRLGGRCAFQVSQLLFQCSESEQYRRPELISLACMEEGASGLVRVRRFSLWDWDGQLLSL
jgi:hypothetical protein